MSCVRLLAIVDWWQSHITPSVILPSQWLTLNFLGISLAQMNNWERLMRPFPCKPKHSRQTSTAVRGGLGPGHGWELPSALVSCERNILSCTILVAIASASKLGVFEVLFWVLPWLQLNNWNKAPRSSEHPGCLMFSWTSKVSASIGSFLFLGAWWRKCITTPHEKNRPIQGAGLESGSEHPNVQCVSLFGVLSAYLERHIWWLEGVLMAFFTSLLHKYIICQNESIHWP